jgi:FkbM family methyltransferase
VIASSLYDLKKLVLAPRTASRRRRAQGHLRPGGRALYEQHYYRTPMFEFMVAAARNPDLLIDVDIDEDSVVFDVGAFRGEWSRRVWDRYHPTIHAFEPAPGASEHMTSTFAGHPKVTVHPFGLGRADLTVPLTLDGPGSSIYGESSGYGRVEVRIRDVVPVLDELGIERIDLLKVNIEGGEYDLIDRLEAAGWLPRTRLLLIQYHEWHPNAYVRRRRNRRALRRDHHEVWCYSWCWELWRLGDPPPATEPPHAPVRRASRPAPPWRSRS